MLKKIFVSILFFYNLIQANSNVENISLQLKWKHQFQFAGYYIAHKKGYYNDVDLNVTFKEWKAGINVSDEVNNKNSDYGIDDTSLLIDKSNNDDIVLLYALLQSSPEVIISKKSLNINNIDDFKNKTIMLNNNSLNKNIFEKIVHNNDKINIDDVKIIKPTYDLSDLINNKVDLINVYITNETYELSKKNIKYNIFSFIDYGIDSYGDILFTNKTKSLLHEKRTNNFVNASLKGWKYAFDNIEETVDLVYNKYNTQNKTKNELVYEANELKKLAYKNDNKLGSIEYQKIRKIIDNYRILGLINNNFDINTVLFNRNDISIGLTNKEKLYISNNKIFKMCNSSILKPIEFSEDGITKGISIDLLEILEKKLKIKFKSVKTKNSEESQIFLKEKKCDILTAAVSTFEREKYANFTKPYLNYKTAIVTQNDSPLIHKLRDVAHTTMSINKGNTLMPTLKEKYPKLKIIETNNYLESLRMVQNNKANFTIAALPIALTYISTFNLDNLHISGYTDMVYNLSIAVRDDDKLLFDILNKSLSAISNKEQYNIENKWISNKIIPLKENYLFFYKIIAVLLFFGLIIGYKQNVLYKKNKFLHKLIKEKNDELGILNKTILSDSSKLNELSNILKNKIRDEVDKNVKIEKKLNESNSIIFNVSTIINKSIEIEKDKISLDSIEIICDVDNTIEIYSYPNALTEVIINLIDNSKDAFFENNNIKKYIFINTKMDEDYIYIIIKDNAGGISNNIINKIFEPYFTTKINMQGTGLGLNMVYNLITKNMKGKITVSNTTYFHNNEECNGAKFVISLPHREVN